jgi:hypothetical protein
MGSLEKVMARTHMSTSVVIADHSLGSVPVNIFSSIPLHSTRARIAISLSHSSSSSSSNTAQRQAHMATTPTALGCPQLNQRVQD